MRSRSSLPDAFALPRATGFLAAFAVFMGCSSSRVVRCAINQLYELSILPQNRKGILVAKAGTVPESSLRACKWLQFENTVSFSHEPIEHGNQRRTAGG